MKKIVELLINREDLSEEQIQEMLGVDILSLVDQPAIGYEWYAFSDVAGYVDNKGMEKYKKFLDANVDMMKKPGGGAAGDGGVDHGAQMKILEEAGINTEYPFGYCFQVAQFLFYALGGYESEWQLKCIKKMEYKVDGHDFQSTHWYVQNSKNGRIVDLTAEQFDGILDINEYYEDGRNANLGFPYYNVGDDKVEFDNTVPSLQTLKLYALWKEEHGKIDSLEKFYKASKYEELRRDFAEDIQFVEPKLGEREGEFISRCMSDLQGEFPDRDQRLAVCYANWERNDMQDIDMDAIGNAIIEVAHELGEEHDPKDTVYINPDDFAEENTTVSAVTDAVKALDILKGKRDANEELETVYKYEGPITKNSRKFCRAMVQISRTKAFKKEDIDKMSKAAVDGGAVKKPGTSDSSYDVFKYAGGARCNHRFVEYKWFKSSTGKTLLIKTGNETTKGRDHGIDGFTSRKQKEKADQWAAINLQHQFKVQDEDAQIVVSPAMVPDVLIKRRNTEGQEYYVYFSKETIKEIAEKFFKNNYQNNTDVNHDGNVTTENTLLESWIVEDPEKDKSAMYGFNVPRGTWMISMKINDDETWKKIKTGELKGYSISGQFLEKERVI